MILLRQDLNVLHAGVIEGRRTFANIMKYIMMGTSSNFDILTFVIMLKLFDAGEALFHTGWFIESIATRVLVIFIIRTRGNPFKSRPSTALTVTSLAVVLVAATLPFTPMATHLGFVAPPPLFFAILLGMVLSYLVAVEFVKRWFYRRYSAA